MYSSNIEVNPFINASRWFIVFKKLILQAANTDLFNPLVPKPHNAVCQNLLLLLLQIKPTKSQLTH